MSCVRPASRVLGYCLALSISHVAVADVFINEFHYDNDGTDSNEKVEVIAPAGTNLTGWKIVLYNGGTGGQYSTLNLSGTTASQCGGHGTVVVTAPTATGIQNGAPDGLALVNASNTVVQFLSYEGTFTATDGPASGRASTAVPQSESSTSPAGQSLQLAGTGTTYAQFAWQASRTSSFGACNTGQTFSVPDSAPTVTSTSPAAGATNVVRTSNVTVTFSEAVTVTGTWFTLSCASSGSHPAAVSGGPTTFTLNPNTDFGSLESCTLTLVAANISDQDGAIQTMAANVVRSFTTSSASTGYYGTVNTTSASALRSSLHLVIDDHTRFGYTASTTDTWDVLAVADQDPMNSSRILDIYKNASYAKATGGNNFYNREHTWPNSLGFPNDGATNYPYTDLHMLMASDISYNSTRGNKPYDNCPSGCTEYPTQATNGQGGGSGVYPGNSNWSNASVFQVWNKFKGNVARAMFYMDLRYEGGTHGVTGAAEPDLRLTSDLSLVVGTGSNASVAYMGKLSTLLQWHIDDPVDASEQLRNDVVYSYQGNRNPFVDNPQWVACIYQSVCQ
jgi:endonuclease I